MVRVVGVPDLTGMDRRARAECKPVFAYLLRKYRVVDGFDRDGRAELNVIIRNGRHRGRHTVWIEPFLLRIRRSRAKS